MSHRWKLIIAVAVVMLVLMVVWVVTFFVTPDNDVEAYRKSLIAKGEKLEISQVMPAPVPPEQNGAEVVRQAFRLLIPMQVEYTNSPEAMWPVAPGKAMVAFKQSEVRIRYITNSWSNVLSTAEANRPAMEFLRQAASFPAISFDLDYSNEMNVGMASLTLLWPAALGLSAETICDLHQGDAALAATNIDVLLALVNEEQGERLFYIQQLRVYQLDAAARDTWELLQSDHLKDEPLAMLQAGWERLEFVHSAENTLMMARAMNEAEIKKMRTSNEYADRVMRAWTGGMAAGGSGAVWQNAKRTASRALWLESWTYSDELLMLQEEQIILEAIRTVETNGYFNPAFTNMQNQCDAMTTNETGSFLEKLDDHGVHRLFASRSRGLARSFGGILRSEAARQMTVAAIALKRYQLKHGGYPEKLDSLVPEFVAKVPRDPIDGKPLRYRLNADGTFVLYSIGENGVDDGGTPAASAPTRSDANFFWLNDTAPDWVWPQPATAAEIEYYYDHLPR